MSGIRDTIEQSERRGTFYVVFAEQAIELKFEVGGSGLTEQDLDAMPTSKDDFIKGLVALLVEEAEGGNFPAASRVAGLLADVYEQDVLVLDAQLSHTDVLVGEMHFIDGDTLEERHERAKEILEGCLQPSTSKYLH